MRILLFGYGSIGQRHAANLKRLRPDAELRITDPLKGMIAELHSPNDIDAAIIASPTSVHAEQMEICDWGAIPFYVEKPVGSTRLPKFSDFCAVGHQYRFHPVMPQVAETAAKHGVLHFRASDDLLARYGPDVDGIIAAHPIDTALWLLGPAFECSLESDGRHFHGSIKHERGISTHDYYIDRGPRVSTVTAGKTFDLYASDQMYLDCLGAWLHWVEGGAMDPRTCTLGQGLEVMRVLEQVKHAQVSG